MPAESHLMRPGEHETSHPIMIGSRPNSGRRQDKSTLLNFEKYLLAASPPINFAFSYGGTSRNCQTFADDINNNNNNKYCGVGSCGVNSNKLGGIDSKSTMYQPNKDTMNASGSWTRKISLPLPEKNCSGSERNRKTGIYSYNFKEAPGSNDYLISEICSAIGNGVSISTEKIFRSCLRSQILTERSDDEEQPSVSPPRVKKVSFADCVGFPLINVRIFDEMPDTPSVVNPEVIRRHAAACSQASTVSGASSTSTNVRDTQSGSTDIISTPRSPFLIPNFSMPAANYAEFREKLNNDFVSLESVHLSDHTGALVGTVRVKDVAFEKSVLLRCTFDEWASHKDVQATYVEPRVPTPANVPSFATFSFRLELPEDSRAGCKFAVRYETNGREYWDNNKGDNYELICPDWSNKTGADSRFNRNSTEGVAFSSNDLRPEGGSWMGVDSSCPYY